MNKIRLPSNLIPLALILMMVVFFLCLVNWVRRDTPRCLECRKVSYSKSYCEHCGEWIKPLYCISCKTKEYNAYKPDKFCDDCGTILVVLTENPEK